MSKLYILLTLFFLSICAPIQAQTPEFGAKIGGLASTVTGDNSDEHETATSPIGSLFVKLPISYNFSIQPEIQYARYGASSVLSPSDQLNLDQIIIPIKLAYYPTINGNESGFFVNAGPQISFTVLDVIIDNGERFDFGETIRADQGSFEPIDFGGTLNVGYEFDFGPWIEAGAYHSIFSVWETSVGEQKFNAAASITVGANLSTIFDDY